MNIEQILSINFNSLKDYSSYETLGVKQANIFVVEIPYFNKTYYLIHNYKSEFIKVKLKDDKEIKFNSRIFISEYFPEEIQVSKGSKYSSGIHTSSEVSTLDDLNTEGIVDDYHTYAFKVVKKELIEAYFINEFLIQEDKIDQFLFKIPVTEEEEKSILQVGSLNKLSVSYGPTFNRSLPKSTTKDGYIYTNNYLPVKDCLEQLRTLISKGPVVQLVDIKKQIKLKLSNIDSYLRYTRDRQSLEKLDDSLELVCENLNWK